MLNPDLLLNGLIRSHHQSQHRKNEVIRTSQERHRIVEALMQRCLRPIDSSPVLEGDDLVPDSGAQSGR